MQYNPNSPATKGLEWAPTASGLVTLDSNIKMAAVSFDQSLAEATGALKLHVDAATVGGIYAVEVYDNENAVVANFAVGIAVPNEDVSGMGTGTGQWAQNDGLATTIFSQIDEYPLLTASDFIQSSAWSSNPAEDVIYYGRMNTGALALTGKRILSVTLFVRGWSYYGGANGVRAGLNIGGVDHTVVLTLGTSYGAPATASKVWSYNPATKKPWTVADIALLDTTDEWFVQRVGNGYLVIETAWLSVWYCDENRVAVGALDHTSSVGTVPAWQQVTLTTPTGGTWTKDASGKHLYTVRRMNSAGSISLPYLEAAAALPVANGWSPSLHPSSGHVISMGGATNKIMPVIQRWNTGPADSVDSLSYAAMVDALVYSGQDAEQEFSGATVQNYGILRFLVKPGSTADCLVKLKRRSDNAQFGTTLTLTWAEMTALPNAGDGWRFVTASLPTPGLLATGTQYYIEFSSTATAANAWKVRALDTTSNTDGVSATFGGTTDRAVVNGTEADRYDLVVTIGSTPAAVTGFTATLGSQTINATVCGTNTIARADMSWNATALGASFGYYEIDRSEDAGATWVTVMRITTEATNTWNDYEALRGIAVQYRIRVARVDGAISPVSATQSVTKPTAGLCASLLLVSNYDPTYNCAYEYQPDKEWEFHEADEAVTVAAYLRDNQLGFLPLEARGTTVRYTIIVGVDDQVPAGGGLGVDAFAPLRAIAHAPLPYVCVLDFYGTRQFALLRVPGGSVSEPAARYVAQFAATTVDDVPFAS